RGGGGGWGSSNQRYSNVIQPSSFKSDTWGGSRDHGRGFFGSSDFGSSGSSSSRNADFSQNRFSALASSQSAADGSKDEEERLLECVVKDMEIWESSGQWIFSCYSPMKEKMNVSGFSDVSPEELRLEYYDSRANNTIGNYGINDGNSRYFFSRNRYMLIWKITLRGLIEIKEVNFIQTNYFRMILLNCSELQCFESGYFFSGNMEEAKVSLRTSAYPAAGSSSAAANPPAFETASSPSAPQALGFGSAAAPSAASFSFKAAATAGGFGTSGFSGFGSAAAVNSASTTVLPAFGAFSATGATSASPSSGALFGQSGSASGHPVTSASAAATNPSPASEKLFTPKTELSAEEWQQFEAKEFTIGKIPLKPPPLELL
ncbi:NUPL2 protein, partial [Panurus biarmicus]|nr:NUPL2 protein [Panurus biarmicus]